MCNAWLVFLGTQMSKCSLLEKNHLSEVYFPSVEFTLFSYTYIIILLILSSEPFPKNHYQVKAILLTNSWTPTGPIRIYKSCSMYDDFVQQKNHRVFFVFCLEFGFCVFPYLWLVIGQRICFNCYVEVKEGHTYN